MSDGDSVEETDRDRQPLKSSPEEHPGKKYERIAERYEPAEPDDLKPTTNTVGASGHGDSDVSAKLQTRFWLLVLVFNLALLAFSVGLMLVVFEGDQTAGPLLVVAGTVLFGVGIYRYVQTRRRLQRGDFHDDQNS